MVAHRFRADDGFIVDPDRWLNLKTGQWEIREWREGDQYCLSQSRNPDTGEVRCTVSRWNAISGNFLWDHRLDQDGPITSLMAAQMLARRYVASLRNESFPNG